jgi:hypothetical protein
VTLVIWSNAEATVTIIAASIPILRSLLKQARPPPAPRARPFVPYKYPTDDFDMQSRGTVTIESRGRSSWRGSHLSWTWEDAKDNKIAEANAGKILQIQEVAVEYDYRNDDERRRQDRAQSV